MKTIVRLNRPYGLNNAGEVCGFSDAEAQSLIDAGAADKLSEKEIKALKSANPDDETAVETRTTKAKPKGTKDK